MRPIPLALTLGLCLAASPAVAGQTVPAAPDASPPSAEQPPARKRSLVGQVMAELTGSLRQQARDSAATPATDAGHAAAPAKTPPSPPEALAAAGD